MSTNNIISKSFTQLALYEGKEDTQLALYEGNEDKNDILLKNQFAAYMDANFKNDKVMLVHIYLYLKNKLKNAINWHNAISEIRKNLNEAVRHASKKLKSRNYISTLTKQRIEQLLKAINDSTTEEINEYLRELGEVDSVDDQKLGFDSVMEQFKEKWTVVAKQNAVKFGPKDFPTEKRRSRKYLKEDDKPSKKLKLEAKSNDAGKSMDIKKIDGDGLEDSVDGTKCSDEDAEYSDDKNVSKNFASKSTDNNEEIWGDEGNSLFDEETEFNEEKNNSNAITAMTSQINSSGDTTYDTTSAISSFVPPSDSSAITSVNSAKFSTCVPASSDKIDISAISFSSDNVPFSNIKGKFNQPSLSCYDDRNIFIKSVKDLYRGLSDELANSRTNNSRYEDIKVFTNSVEQRNQVARVAPTLGDNNSRYEDINVFINTVEQRNQVARVAPTLGDEYEQSVAPPAIFDENLVNQLNRNLKDNSSKAAANVIDLINSDGDANTSRAPVAAQIPSREYEKLLLRINNNVSNLDSKFQRGMLSLLQEIRSVEIKDDNFVYKLHKKTTDGVLLNIVAMVQNRATSRIMQYAVKNCMYQLLFRFKNSCDKVPPNGLCGLTSLFNVSNLNSTASNYESIEYLQKISDFHTELMKKQELFLENTDLTEIKKLDLRKKSTLRTSFIKANLDNFNRGNPKLVINKLNYTRNSYPIECWFTDYDLPDVSNGDIPTTVLNYVSSSDGFDFAEVRCTNVLLSGSFNNYFQELNIICASTPMMIVYKASHFFNLPQKEREYTTNLHRVQKKWVESVCKLVENRVDPTLSTSDNLSQRFKLGRCLHELLYAHRSF